MRERHLVEESGQREEEAVDGEDEDGEVSPHQLHPLSLTARLIQVHPTRDVKLVPLTLHTQQLLMTERATFK